MRTEDYFAHINSIIEEDLKEVEEKLEPKVIPSMPKPGQMGQEPRDPTVDEIIKQLKGLDGEAKRGAIAGLTDLLSIDLTSFSVSQA